VSGEYSSRRTAGGGRPGASGRPGFRVRPAEATDQAAIGRLLVEVFVGEGHSPPSAAGRLEDGESLSRSGRLLMAELDDGEPVGAVLLIPGGDTARVAGPGAAAVRLLATRPAVRGRGAGHALMRECIALARQTGIRRLVLWTQPSMGAARRLYEALDFERAPTRDWTAGPGRRMLVYQKDL
jgi:ribosomal protein S18 acetylase RimI-like enzyme